MSTTAVITNPVKLKGASGATITSTTDGADERLDVDAKVSGVVAVGAATATQTGTITVFAGAAAGTGYGVLSTTAPPANSFQEFDCTSYTSVDVVITGTFTGTLWFDATADGTNYFTVVGSIPGATSSALQFSTTTPTIVRFATAGLQKLRVRTTSSFTAIVGAITVFFGASSLPGQVQHTDVVRSIGSQPNGSTSNDNPILIGARTPGGKAATVPGNAVGISALSLPEAVLAGAVTGLALVALGQVATAAVAEAAVRATAYVEQTAGAQRSIVSTSALDAAAGTGARTVRVTYYTNTAGVIAGPFTEDLTMNGLVAVNTVATNICFIEKMEVLTAGATGVNQGAINLMTLIGGAGVVFAQIAALARRTLYAHHYVASGATCGVNGITITSTATTGNAPMFELRQRDPTAALPGSAEKIVISGQDVQGSTGVRVVDYNVAPIVVGPAVIVAYVTPTNAAAQVQRMTMQVTEV